MNFVIENGILIKCTDEACKEAVIPNGVRIIGERAFENCSQLERVILPDSVEGIEDCAFFLCKALTHITLSENLKELTWNSFRYCENLTDVCANGVHAEAVKAIIKASTAVHKYCSGCLDYVPCNLISQISYCRNHHAKVIEKDGQRIFSFYSRQVSTVYAEHDSGADGYEEEIYTWEMPLPSDITDAEVPIYVVENLDKLKKSSDYDYRPAFG